MSSQDKKNNKLKFYQISIKRADGKKETFELECDSRKTAEYEGLRRGTQIISIKEKSNFELIQVGMTPEERNTFLYTLATLSSAISMNEALFLMQQNFSGNIKKVCSKLSRLIAFHEPQDAIEIIGPPHFPTSVIAMIKAGASAGSLTDALREAADFEQEMIAIKKESGKGMVQAIVSFILAVIVVFGVMFGVVPWMETAPMFKAMKVDITWLHPFGYSTLWSMMFFFVLFMFFALLGTLGRVISPNFSDDLILKIPMYRDLVLSKNNFVTIYQLSRLIDKGIPLKVSLVKTTENTGKGRLRSDLEGAIERLNKGTEWSEALTTFSPMDKAALRASTDAKKISRTLRDLSIQYKNTYKLVVERVATTLFFIGFLYLGVAALLLFAYTTIPVLDGLANGMNP